MIDAFWVAIFSVPLISGVSIVFVCILPNTCKFSKLPTVFRLL